ncbi:MAG TPA: toast rack family protein, partial [Bacillota bacterium]
GELTLFGGSQALVEAHLEERNWPASMRPEVTSEGNDVTIKQATNGVSTGSARQKWDIRLNSDLPMAIVANVGAGSNRLDLRETKVESLDFNTGASSTTITLGDRVPLCRVNIKAGAASTKVEVPRSAGVKVTVQTGIGSSNLSSLQYNRDGRTWTSPDYDSASTKIEINFTGGIGSFELLPR